MRTSEDDLKLCKQLSFPTTQNICISIKLERKFCRESSDVCKSNKVGKASQKFLMRNRRLIVRDYVKLCWSFLLRMCMHAGYDWKFIKLQELFIRISRKTIFKVT